MNSLFKYLVILSSAFLGASTAHAEVFNGPHIEIRSGWDSLHSDGDGAKTQEVAIGIGGGYDFSLGDNCVVGVEVAVDFFDTESIGGLTAAILEAIAKRDLEANIRAGYRLGKNFLVYAKAGYANARIEEVLVLANMAGNITTEFVRDLHGIRMGAGVEAIIGGGFFAKAEFRYTNYKSDISRRQVMAAVGYRF